MDIAEGKKRWKNKGAVIQEGDFDYDAPFQMTSEIVLWLIFILFLFEKYHRLQNCNSFAQGKVKLSIPKACL